MFDQSAHFCCDQSQPVAPDHSMGEGDDFMPGESIVVPEKLDKGVVLRGFKDRTQIISTFVIGAAATKVLFR